MPNLKTINQLHKNIHDAKNAKSSLIHKLSKKLNKEFNKLIKEDENINIPYESDIEHIKNNLDNSENFFLTVEDSSKDKYGYPIYSFRDKFRPHIRFIILDNSIKLRNCENIREYTIDKITAIVEKWYEANKHYFK